MKDFGDHFCILEAQEDSWALVTATGSLASKGGLLRDMIHFQRHSFQFDLKVGKVDVAGMVHLLTQSQNLLKSDFFPGD